MKSCFRAVLLICVSVLATNPSVGQTLDPYSFVGTWNGTWTNLTFGSTGPISWVFEYDGTLGLMALTMDAGGNVFGAADPPADNIVMVFNESGGAAAFNSTLFGASNLTLDTAGNLTIASPAVPNPFIESVSTAGTFAGPVFNAALTITFPGGGIANSVVTMNKVILPIAAPTNLAAAENPDGSVMLNWTDASDNERRFEIERQMTGTGKGMGPLAYSKIAEVGPDVTTYNDASAVGGVSYDYRVRGANPDAASPYSNVVTIQTTAPNQAPGAFAITSPADASTLTFGGAQGQPPEPVGDLFRVMWSASVDPNGDPVTYRWELASTQNFGTIESTEQVGAAAFYQTAESNMATFLEGKGVPLFGSVSWFHRVTASDGTLETTSPVFSITLVRGAIGLPNTAPTAADDRIDASEDTSVDIDVLANDSDTDGDPLTLSIITPPTHGQATVHDGGTPSNPADDRIRFTPTADYHGPDALTYQIEDGRGGAAQASVSITVLPVNDPPAAAAITSPAEGQTVIVGGPCCDDPLVSAGMPFVFTWDPSTDVDNDPLTYLWELSTSQDFSSILLSFDAGTATRYETTVGALAALLTSNGVEPFGTKTLFHRVTTSDGSLTTPSIAQITLIRGGVTGVDEDGVVPGEYALGQNYPNPFGVTTSIEYSVPRPGHVRLEVYDLGGRVVTRLVDGVRAPGRHTTEFDAGPLPSGVYMYRMQADGFTQTRELVVLR